MRLFLQSAVIGLSVLSCNSSLNASWTPPMNPNYFKYSSNEAALRAGIAKSDPYALYIKGALYYNSQDYSNAAKFFQRAAERGNPDAKEILAEMYRDGQGVPLNLERAIALWEQASRDGHLTAMHLLGNLLISGNPLLICGKQPYPPIPKDIPRGIALLQTATEKGNPYSAFSLAQYYIRGITGAVDYKEAQRLFEIAAKAGVQIAGENAKLAEVFYFLELEVANFMNRTSNVINTAFQVGTIFSLLSGKPQNFSMVDGIAAAFSTVRPEYGMAFKTFIYTEFDTPAKIISASEADFERVVSDAFIAIWDIDYNRAIARGENLLKATCK
jgi:tetratricopeptide (TPR) repeat protein